MKTRFTQRGLIVPVLPPMQSPVGIYRIWSPHHSKSYIGSTVDFQKRAHDHWRDAQKDVESGPKAIFDAGFDDVQFEVLEFLPADTPKYSTALLDTEEKWAREYYERGELVSELIGMRWSDKRRTTKWANGRPSREQIGRNLRSVKAKVEYLERLLSEVDDNYLTA